MPDLGEDVEARADVRALELWVTIVPAIDELAADEPTVPSDAVALE